MTGIAIVTGGGSGIGAATARKLADHGFTVGVADIDFDTAQKTAADCGAGAWAMRCDVTRADDIAAIFAEAAERGELRALVNNAGAGGSQLGIYDLDVDEWDATMALLLRSVAICTHHAARAMAAGGAIVNVASVASFGPGYSPLAYAVAKAGVLQLTRVTAAELAHRAIRVNAVCPGLILTGIYTAGLKDYPQAAEAVAANMAKTAPGAQPLAMAGLPEHVADNIVHLATPASAFVTGTHIVVDGGLTVGPRHSWDPAMWEERRMAREKMLAAAMAGG